MVARREIIGMKEKLRSHPAPNDGVAEQLCTGTNRELGRLASIFIAGGGAVSAPKDLRQGPSGSDQRTPEGAGFCWSWLSIAGSNPARAVQFRPMVRFERFGGLLPSFGFYWVL